MFSNSRPPKIPDGFYEEVTTPPSPILINRLLSKSSLPTYPTKKLSQAIINSDFFISIFEIQTKKLCGFVRVTSDKGLNANLWNLMAIPGEYQETFFGLLIYRSLNKIKKEMPGCSISVSAPYISTDILKRYGFVIDPGGIRTMEFKLK